MRLSVPFPNQPGARHEVRSLPVQALQPVHHRQTRLVGMGTIESLSGLMIKVAKTIGLDLEGQDGKQQMPRQVRRRRPQENALPAGAQPLEIEIAQLRDFSSAVYLTTIPSSTPTCFYVRRRRIESRAYCALFRAAFTRPTKPVTSKVSTASNMVTSLVSNNKSCHCRPLARSRPRRPLQPPLGQPSPRVIPTLYCSRDIEALTARAKRPTMNGARRPVIRKTKANCERGAQCR